MTDERYGKNKLGKEYILQDYPLTYDEMEPYYTAFEMALGVAGEPGYFGRQAFQAVCHASSGENARFVQVRDGGEADGCHPYMIPAAIASEPIHADGVTHNPCMYCGFCERFGCEYDAKAEPNNTFIPVAEKTGNCEIRCNANVVEILKKGNKVTGVRYIDTLTLEEFIQPADVVVLSSYVMNNASCSWFPRSASSMIRKRGRARWAGATAIRLRPARRSSLKNP